MFSNLTVSMFGVFILTLNGYVVDNIKITMTDYFLDTDVYSLLFTKKDVQLSFDDIDESDINFFLYNCHPTMCGLGMKSWGSVMSTKENFNLKITSKIIDKFFNPNQNVLNNLKSMMESKNIKGEDYVFIWARKTDKVEETSVPDAETYFRVLSENNLLNERIFIQTDDITMFNDFIKIVPNCERFEDIPFAKDYTFHRLISRTNDDIFYSNYNLTKEEYMVKMFCVVFLAVKSKKAIIYPGNPTTVVPMYKNSFLNCILFKNGSELF